MSASSLQVSIVTYHPNEDVLIRCLYALSEAIEFARTEGVLQTVNVALIDNSESTQVVRRLVELGDLFFREPTQASYLHGHANIGYGAAHNLTLHGSGADYHLVLSVDAELSQTALSEGVRWMDAHDDVGAVTPSMFAPDGSRLYPCHRYPTVLDIFLADFAPIWLRNLNEKRLKAYKMRTETNAHEAFFDVPCLSSVCILARRRVTDQSSGFDPDFFLYFEDYDWSMRLALIARTACVPAMRLTFHGANGAGRRIRHKKQYLKSAVHFFRKHGWKWW